MLRGKIFWDRKPREMHQIKALTKGYWACRLHLRNRLSLVVSADFSEKNLHEPRLSTASQNMSFVRAFLGFLAFATATASKGSPCQEHRKLPLCNFWCILFSSAAIKRSGAGCAFSASHEARRCKSAGVRIPAISPRGDSHPVITAQNPSILEGGKKKMAQEELLASREHGHCFSHYTACFFSGVCDMLPMCAKFTSCLFPLCRVSLWPPRQSLFAAFCAVPLHAAGKQYSGECNAHVKKSRSSLFDCGSMHWRTSSTSLRQVRR